VNVYILQFYSQIFVVVAFVVLTTQFVKRYTVYYCSVVYSLTRRTARMNFCLMFIFGLESKVHR